MSPFFGEFMGTLVLVFLGNGVVANSILTGTKGNSTSWMVIATGWAFAVMLGIFVANAFGSTDAHLNPAVTLAFAITDHSFCKLLPYWSAQVLGAFMGSVLVYVHYRPHWSVTTDPAVKRGAFTTSPAIRRFPDNLASEALGTAVLVIASGAISGAGKLAVGWGPYLVGIVVWSIGLSLGGTTGYAINPARDLGPRLAYSVLPMKDKGTSDWAYAWVPIVGPLLGAAVGALVMNLV